MKGSCLGLEGVLGPGAHTAACWRGGLSGLQLSRGRNSQRVTSSKSKSRLCCPGGRSAEDSSQSAPSSSVLYTNSNGAYRSIETCVLSSTSTASRTVHGAMASCMLKHQLSSPGLHMCTTGDSSILRNAVQAASCTCRHGVGCCSLLRLYIILANP